MAPCLPASGLLVTVCVMVVTMVTPGHTYSVDIHGAPARPFDGCDNGQVNLEVDWDPSDKEVYTCHEVDKKGRTKTRSKGKATVDAQECTIDAAEPTHKCLPEKIFYSDALPTSGAHRPVWPAYGQYRYIPVQRWLHSLEHGAIVFLYHPCADTQDIEALMGVAKGCLRRHIISPYPGISQGWNFAVLAWKCKYLFQTPNVAELVKFIKEHALNGPEDIAEDGNYTAGLEVPAQTVYDMNDTVLCPTSSERAAMSETLKKESFLSGGSLFDHHGGVENRFEPIHLLDLTSDGKSKVDVAEGLKNAQKLIKSEEKDLESKVHSAQDRLAQIRKHLMWK